MCISFQSFCEILKTKTPYWKVENFVNYSKSACQVDMHLIGATHIYSDT